jgi:glycosyltransferase involved in cell wall biosynthesis
MSKGSLDIVVGVCTKNCADTVAGVLKTVDRGLAQFFPSKRILIVVSDGFSTDATQEKVQTTEMTTEVVFTPQTGGLGKGNGVRTILEIARERGASAVALVDGDLTSIESSWVHKLAGPILDGKDLVVPYYLRHHYDGVITNQIAYPLTDLVVPYYLRHHYDGVITNQIAYPLTNVLFGVGVRQPIGGEYGISARLLERLLQHELFPEKFGIDIFITLVATSERMEIAEAVLGVKEHESTKQYADPDKLLVPMFYQVVGTLFRLINYYHDYIETVHEVRPVERLGEMPDKHPGAITVHQKDLLRRFKEKYAELMGENAAFLGDLREDLDRIASRELDSYSFPLPLWVKAVYLAIDAFSVSEDLKILDVLRVLWQGRFLSLVRETEAMSTEDAEAYIRGQLTTFERHRSALYD